MQESFTIHGRSALLLLACALVVLACLVDIRRAAPPPRVAGFDLEVEWNRDGRVRVRAPQGTDREVGVFDLESKTSAAAAMFAVREGAAAVFASAPGNQDAHAPVTVRMVVSDEVGAGVLHLVGAGIWPIVRIERLLLADPSGRGPDVLCEIPPERVYPDNQLVFAPDRFVRALLGGKDGLGSPSGPTPLLLVLGDGVSEGTRVEVRGTWAGVWPAQEGAPTAGWPPLEGREAFIETGNLVPRGVRCGDVRTLASALIDARASRVFWAGARAEFDVLDPR